MKTVLGLDLGTNSIGWALTTQDFKKKQGEIIDLGSRIIPMSQDIIDKFGQGQSHSQTAERTRYRGVRRLYQRDHLRRERLHRVLNRMGFLPPHYADAIDFEKHPGQFREIGDDGYEVRINYVEDGQKPNGKPHYRFLFKSSFDEMVHLFNEAGHASNIPADWTIYYLRKKALSSKIRKEELAWILLNFNQKRGYYQRSEEEETDRTKLLEYYALKVLSVEATDEQNAKGTWYNVNLENGWVYRRPSKTALDDWAGKIREFIVTTPLEKDGKTPKKNRDGEVMRTFRAVDSENDWIAIKSKTEWEIENAQKTVGEYIFEALLQKPDQKIRGKLVRTIERRFYKEELRRILIAQSEYHPELKDENLYQACIRDLYPNNDGHRNNISKRGFVYLFLEDILFYQRPLKSKKSTISKCSLEKRSYSVPGEDGVRTEGLKCIPKSHPLFQEFRIWQFLNNLRILRKDAREEVNVTDQVIPTDKIWVALYELFNGRKEVEQKHVLDLLVKNGTIARSEKSNYRWNYMEEKSYPGNETRSALKKSFSRIEGMDDEAILNQQREYHLWHIVYSIGDKDEYEKALSTYARRYGIPVESFVEVFKGFKPFERAYGAYSEKAIKKLLPLMRRGMYWNEDNISDDLKKRIDKIIDGETDERISNRSREKLSGLTAINQFQGLATWMASYVVYGRHSEAYDQQKWNSPADIDEFLSGFRQHSLRNPIVEQVVTETLRLVRDIWLVFGEGKADYFDEIHVELGRDMKSSADKREHTSKLNQANERTNSRIRLLLQELMNDDEIEGDVRPYSRSHQEILKIFEEGVYLSKDVVVDEIDKIRKTKSPTSAEIRKYRIWLEQGYISPYTGKIIPLGKLFTPAYQIEHIIPQARYFDNSLSNKVICESEVNELKSDQTAYEFIKKQGGTSVHLTGGKVVDLFTLEEYEEHCSHYFSGNRQKLQKLLSEDIPDGFIERQMNDSRYISKMIKNLLNCLVRSEDDDQAISPNLLPVVGAVTSKLKQDWGLHDKWNRLVAPRFERMNEISNSSQGFGYWDEKIRAFRCQVPDEYRKGFSLKRIDHRHHALDALVVACTQRAHTQYLHALNAERENYSLRNSLLIKNGQGHYTKTMQMPWQGFPEEALAALSTCVVSFKQNTRVINKSNNRTAQWTEKNGQKKKVYVPQKSGDTWAVRKPMHKETISGAVKVRIKRVVSFSNGLKDWEKLVDKELKSKVKKMLKEGKNLKAILKFFKENPYAKQGVPTGKVEVYDYTKNATASRVLLTKKFTRKQLDSVTDSGIRKILDRHLQSYAEEKGKERFDLAFSPEGIEALNENIVELNGGKQHQPIYKVRVFEEGKKFPLGFKGNKKKKFVEAAKGTNLFFAVYYNPEKGKREFESVPLEEAIQHQKLVAMENIGERTPVSVNNDKGQLLFVLSPNDLVYLPTQEEIDNPASFNSLKLSEKQVNRIYKMVSCTSSEVYFIPQSVSKTIVDKEEFSKKNKMGRAIDGTMIKETCWKIEVDRIGAIKSVRR